MKLSLLACLVCCACNTVDSSSILTSGMYASISATSDGSQTDVSTTLYLGNPGNLDFIDLMGDDELTATTGNLTRPMNETVVLGTASYHASFDASEADTEFVVSLTRTVDDGAPDSRCDLPDPFDIDTAGGATISRADDLTVDWSPQGSDDMAWRLSGTCIQDQSGTVDGDPGTLTVAGNTIMQPQSATVEESCDVTLTLTRSRPGTLDPHYGKGGEIEGRQTRSLTFTSEP